MSIFTQSVTFVLNHEGRLSDHPSDPGGITNFGISIRFAGSIGLDVDGDGDTDADDIKATTRELAVIVYKDHFWNKLHCDSLPDALAFPMFDSAVNQGTGTAARLMQRALGVKADGHIGPLTIRAATGSSHNEVLHDFMARRAKRYATTPNVETFGRGWFRRLLECHTLALTLLKETT